MGDTRLNKFISNSGYTSRRNADELIFNGEVTVNGVVVIEPGYQVDSKLDRVEVSGKPIAVQDDFIYIMLHKPEKYITTVKDQFGRPSVIDLIDLKDRIYPVGRLDYDSKGLLLLTNDGSLTFKLTHPSHDVPKTYLVQVKGNLDATILAKLSKGIYIDGYRTKPCVINVIGEIEHITRLSVIISEGRNRQIRKMFEKFKCRVVDLKRVSMGELKLGNLPVGKWRHLTTGEVNYLKERI
ncbi:MAG: Pseudouridine synthase, Rsu [Clostridiales bacterium 38_11]|nr:MAG: Pseudouridine synthase, Rsu [Clostridiales bacterium 38_11]HBH11833.1 pseudouridine synthase [Clostridiales bacterium]